MQPSVGGNQKQQSLPFQHFNYAKQINKAGTGAFLYQSVKYADVLNQQAAEDRDGERGGVKTDELNAFDLVPPKYSQLSTRQSHILYFTLSNTKF